MSNRKAHSCMAPCDAALTVVTRRPSALTRAPALPVEASLRGEANGRAFSRNIAPARSLLKKTTPGAALSGDRTQA